MKDVQKQKMREAEENSLFEAVSMLEDKEQVRLFLTDLCTPQELRSFTERWKIARLLSQGHHSYRDISAQTGASTTTVGRVARFLHDEPHGGYRHCLEKIKS